MKKRKTPVEMVLFVVLVCSISYGDWSPHSIRLLNGSDKPFETPAQIQIVTEKLNKVTAVPYIVYMPEKDRVLMLIAYEYPHEAAFLTSDDRGATWSAPRFAHTDAEGKSDAGMGVGLTYLGDGHVLFMGGWKDHNQEGGVVWRSHDYGQTWQDPTPIPLAPGSQPWHTWDPLFVQRDAKTNAITRLIGARYTVKYADPNPSGNDYHSRSYFVTSPDLGKTWTEGVAVPEWDGLNEIAFCQAVNGDLVAACRTDKPERFKNEIDHYEGLVVSISKDQGKTWSPLNRLYEYGRHHPSLLVLPNGHILMTYVVRKGYIDSPDGHPQFGIEAVVSRDNGQTWDLDHRYILNVWKSYLPANQPNSWWPSSQSTSTVLLPDGSILTAFGTGYRSQSPTTGPRDVGVIHWRLNETAVLNGNRTMVATPYDSPLRNLFDPATNRPVKQSGDDKTKNK